MDCCLAWGPSYERGFQLLSDFRRNSAVFWPQCDAPEFPGIRLRVDGTQHLLCRACWCPFKRREQERTRECRFPFLLIVSRNSFITPMTPCSDWPLCHFFLRWVLFFPCLYLCQLPPSMKCLVMFFLLKGTIKSYLLTCSLTVKFVAASTSKNNLIHAQLIKAPRKVSLVEF